MQKPISRRDFLKLAPLGLSSLGAFSPLGRLAEDWLAAPELSINSGYRDVLTEAQKKALLQASLHFLAPDGESANRVALEIDFIEGLNEHASNMCGPLSISILQRAGLLGNWVQPQDFWLLNPREDLLTALNVFPKHLYDWVHFEEPLVDFDFKQFPLMAGDLLYLHAAPGDTFEHILVVNRVDSRGRAFTVSNFFTLTETIIEERMLYDPQKPGSGQFERWADRDIRNTIGNTGRGGFRVWRVKNGRWLEGGESEARAELTRTLDNLFIVGPGNWYAEVRNKAGQTIYQFNPYEAFHPASTIKLPIALAFMAWLGAEELTDEAGYLESKGTAGRSFAQLLRAMLVESEEKATEELVEFLVEGAINSEWQGWGYTRSMLGPRRSSAWELLNFFEDLMRGERLSEFQRDYLLELLGSYTPNDDGRAGLMKPALPQGSLIYNKRASLVEAPRVVGDSGIVWLPEGNEIYFSIHGVGKDGASYEELEPTLEAAFLALGEFLGFSHPA